MESQTNKLAILMTNFSLETVIGQRNGLRKQNIKVTEPMINYAVGTYINYYYKSMILQDDEYVVVNIGNMMNQNGHSLVCLMHILSNIIITMHTTIKDINDEDTYLTLLQNFQSTIIEQISPMLEHECKGEKIKDLDANKPFYDIVTS